MNKIKNQIKQIYYRVILSIKFLHLIAIGNRSFSLNCGKNSVIHLNSILILQSNSKLIMGDNVLISSEKKGYHAGMAFDAKLYVEQGAELSIGNNTRINGACIHSRSLIKIGDNCVIASGVNILDSNGHIVKSLNRTSGRDTPEPIIIGNNVWIGLNVLVLKGTVIGDNCVIQAGSIIKGIFPQNTIIGNNKSKIVSNIIFNGEKL